MSWNENSSNNNFNFIEYSGDKTIIERKNIINVFNDEKNLNGEKIKVLLLSWVGAEGINLKNVRQVHILEPYWNEIKIAQVIGRAVRQCWHLALPETERNVKIYRYIWSFSDSKKNNFTSDYNIALLSLKKYTIINEFLQCFKESWIDCQLFYNNNYNDKNKYNCFSFEHTKYFNKNDNMAGFDYDIEVDKILNNGFYDLNSKIEDITVYEIDAVIYNKHDKTYSNSLKYWYDPLSFVVFDYDLNFPVGKIKNINGIPEKKNNSIYIISELIDIPKFTWS